MDNFPWLCWTTIGYINQIISIWTVWTFPEKLDLNHGHRSCPVQNLSILTPRLEVKQQCHCSNAFSGRSSRPGTLSGPTATTSHPLHLKKRIGLHCASCFGCSAMSGSWCRSSGFSADGDPETSKSSSVRPWISFRPAKFHARFDFHFTIVFLLQGIHVPNLVDATTNVTDVTWHLDIIHLTHELLQVIDAFHSVRIQVADPCCSLRCVIECLGPWNYILRCFQILL